MPRTFGDLISALDPRTHARPRPQPPAPQVRLPQPGQAPALRPGEFNSPPPPHPGLESPFQASVPPVVGSPQQQPGVPNLPPPPAMRQPAAPPQVAGGMIPVPPVPGQLPQGPQPQPVPQVDSPYQGLGLAEQAFIGGQGALPTPNRSAVPAINQYKQDYRQSHLGGLSDAVTELGNANRYNAGRPASPFNPLAAPISGPGMYAQAVNAGGGLMNNAEAQQFQRNVGYMPSQTVGGAFGAPGSQPLPLERTPATGAQIDSFLGQNPNGRFFQGAQAGMVSSPSGPRAGFLSDGALPKNEEAAQRANDNMVSRGYTNQGGRLINPSPSKEQQAAAALFDSRRGGAAKRQADYQKRVSDSQSARQVGVSQRALLKSEGRRLRQGNMTFEERLAAMNPAAAQGRMAAESQAAAAQANLQSNRELGLARIRSAEEISNSRNASNERIAQQKIDAEFPKPAVTPEAKPTTEPPTLYQQASRALAESIGLGVITPGPAPNRPTRRGQPKHGQPGVINRPSRRVAFEDLVPQPGDNEMQARIRKELAQKYTGMRSQLRESGRLK